MPKVSVIIPVYNARGTIDRCVCSILEQRFEDFELILVDDGSNDGSGRLCDGFAEKDGRVSVIHKENGGPSSARNRGIDEAKGEYIAFCDSDDYVHKDWLFVLCAAIERESSALVICDAYKTEPDSDKFSRFIKEFAGDEGIFSADEYYRLFEYGISGFPWNKIYLKSVIDKKLIRFEEGLSLGEDVLFNLEYYKSCDAILIINKPLYYYVVVGDGLTSRYCPNYFEIHKRLYSARLEFIKKDYLKDFCDFYLYTFIFALKNTFDKRNKAGFIKKIRYNNAILRSDEFKSCLQNAGKSKENPKFIKLLERGNYLWIYLRGRLKGIK